MRLRIRLILTILVGLFGHRLQLLDESIVRLSVLPNDVDLLQVTNDRYHAFFDLGRIDLITRYGLLGAFIRRGWEPFTGAVAIRHRHPLRLWQRFEVRSRILTWDEQWFWVHQECRRQGRTTAIALCKLGVRCATGIVGSREALALLPSVPRLRPAPAAVRSFADLEAWLRSQQVDEEERDSSNLTLHH